MVIEDNMQGYMSKSYLANAYAILLFHYSGENTL